MAKSASRKLLLHINHINHFGCHHDHVSQTSSLRVPNSNSTFEGLRLQTKNVMFNNSSTNMPLTSRNLGELGFGKRTFPNQHVRKWNQSTTTNCCTDSSPNAHPLRAIEFKIDFIGKLRFGSQPGSQGP